LTLVVAELSRRNAFVPGSSVMMKTVDAFFSGRFYFRRCGGGRSTKKGLSRILISAPFVRSESDVSIRWKSENSLGAGVIHCAR
jgi:hypothetical protein